MRRLRTLAFASIIGSGIVGLACSGYEGGGDARIVPLAAGSDADGGPGLVRDGSSSDARADGRPSPGPAPSDLDVSEGLLVYYRFDGDGRDALGSRHLSHKGNPSFTPGRVDSAAVLSSTTDRFVDETNALALDLVDTDFTVQAWVRMPSLSNDPTIIVGKVNFGNSSGWHLSFGRNGATFYAMGVYALGGSNAVVHADSWHHVVARRSRSADVIELFHDGRRTLQVETSESPRRSGTAFTIGGTAPGQQPPGERLVDEVAIWTRALSDVEIAALYNDGEGRPVIP